ncbi:MAG: 4Fe-4S dicluster domain-containing protein [Dehalococcoidia bacterium]
MQLGFYFDQTRCTGCDTCTIACKDWNELSLGSEPANWRWVVELEWGKYPDPSVAYLAMSCLHCINAPCVEACPAGAIHKRTEDGIVYVDRNECTGSDECGAMCQTVCPYGAPRFGPESNAKMQKCDFCLERWLQGKLPVCVTACPVRALDAGELDTLRASYGNKVVAAGFEYSAETEPSIVLRSTS